MQGNKLLLGVLDLTLDITRPVHFRLDFIGFVLRLLDEISDLSLFIDLRDSGGQQKNRMKYGEL